VRQRQRGHGKKKRRTEKKKNKTEKNRRLCVVTLREKVMSETLHAEWSGRDWTGVESSAGGVEDASRTANGSSDHWHPAPENPPE